MPEKNTVQLVCVAEFRALDGKTDELITALHSLIAPTHKEKGCLRYELNQRIDDTRWITFIEKWEDRTSFDQHCGEPYIKNYFDNLRPRLVETFEVRLYQEFHPQ